MRGRRELLCCTVLFFELFLSARGWSHINPLMKPRGQSKALSGSLLRVIASRDTDRRPDHFDILPDGTAGAEGIIDLARTQEPLQLRRRARALQKIYSAAKGARRGNEFDREILDLALPTLGAVLIDPCLSLVDTGFVGRLGALSLAAIGPCAAAFNFVFVTASCAFMVSTSVLVSEQRAVNNREAIGRILTLASGLSVALGIVMAGVFYAHSTGLLSLMGAPPEVMSLAVPYLRWRATAFPANMFMLVACGAFRGLGEAKAGLLNAAVVGLVNVVLDPFLMFTCGLNVAGAAIATAAAQWVGALVYAGLMWSKRKELGLGGPGSIPGVKEVKRFIGNGGAMVFRQVCNVGAWTVMASAATRMGVLQIAAHQLILSLWLVIAFVQDALGSAGQVLVAQYLGLARDARKASGAGRSWSGDALRFREAARSIAKRVLTLSLGLGITLATASMNLFPAFLPAVCQSKEVAQLVSNVFPSILYSFPMCCMVWTWDSLFYGASDFMYNAKTVAVASTFGVLGSLLSLRRGWGIKGLWFSMTYVLFGVRMAAHLWRFNSHRGPFGPSAFWSDSPSTAPDSRGTDSELMKNDDALQEMSAPAA